MTVDVAIVGSGMGGSLLAQALLKMGFSVALIEKGSHPRFAIGESTSPLMNLLLEEFSSEFDLPHLLPLATWGAWKNAYPQIGVGKKRGFTYYGHAPGRRFSARADRSDQLLVAASPADPCADTHWLRADTDSWLVEQAKQAGADYREHTEVRTIAAKDGRWRLGLRSDRGAEETIEARFLIDASGGRGPMRTLTGEPRLFENYPKITALYSHFTNVAKIADTPDFTRTPFPSSAPYPSDWAAVHHIYPGGWMWVLRFDTDLVSAGVAMESSRAGELGLGPGGAGWKNFLEAFPSVSAQFADAVAVEPWVYAADIARRTERAAGRFNGAVESAGGAVESTGGAPWAAIPSAAGFIDPFYSTGMTLTLIGITRLAKLLRDSRSAPAQLVDALRDYETKTFEDIDWTAEFIACHYASFHSFPHFAALTNYYFAAASFSEMARRLHRPAPRFLAGDNPVFRAGIARCRAELSQPDPPPIEAFAARIARDIEHKNVAGLAQDSKRNWYGVDLNDVIRNAEKLGFTQNEMSTILADAPWAKCE